MIVQIYGVTCADDAELVNAVAPDHVGVVLDEGIDTWDSVDLPTARSIVATLDENIRLVGLSLAVDPERIRRTVDTLEPQIVHLPGIAEHLAPDDVDALREQLGDVEVMVTIPVRDAESLDMARRFDRCSDYLLLDTVHPETGIVGATGQAHDWSLSARIVGEVETPVILAGGLGPDNVTEAIRQVGPEGVDSEIKTSRPDDRRRKDPDRLRRFVAAARSASTDS